MDITERKLTGEKLAEIEERYHIVADFAYHWEWWKTPDGTFRYMSPSCERITGYKPGEFFNKATLLDEILLEEDHGVWHEHQKDLQSEHELQEVQFRIRRKDGAVRWIEHVCQAIKVDGRFLGIRASNRDITELKLAEEALKESGERLCEAQRIAHLGNWELDLLTNALTWSDEIFRIFEIDPAHFGASYKAFLAAVHPEDRDKVNTAYAQSLKTRNPYSIDHRLIMADGRIKHVREQCETSYDAEGKPLRSVGVVQDITDRKQLQSERIQFRNELAHLNRIMTISELSSYLAHEINQPLGAIMNNAAAARSILSRLPIENDEIREILDDIIADTNRAGQIIRKIRGVVKKGQTRYGPMNLHDMIEDVVRLFQNALNMDQISRQLDLHPELPLIQGDRIGLQQVLTNLISNAMEAMTNSASKVLTIRTHMQAPDMIIVSVSDTGAGIDERIRDKVFEPFFTTKKEGLGIGLRLCRSIIEEHGGRIWMENNPEAGTTFLFSLKTNCNAA